MKKFFYMAVAAIAALSSCSNDDAILGEGGKQNGEGVTTFTATIESDATSRTTYNSTSRKSEWENTDKVNINGAVFSIAPKTDKTTATLTKESGEAPTGTFKAIFPASIATGTTYTLPSSYTYTADKFNMPMYAESTTTSLEFKNLCGVLAITVPAGTFTGIDVKIKTFEVSSNEQMHGTFTVTMSTGENPVPAITFASKTLTEADKKITISCGTEGVDQGKTFYIPIPANTYYPITIKVSDGTNTKIMHTMKQDGVAIARNSIYAISFTENYAKIGSSDDINLLPGVFTVASGKTVRFTRSNLYWNGTAWHFEANQVGYPTASGENYNYNHVGHFYWTKTAAASYAASYNDGTNSTSDVPFFAESKGGLIVEGTSRLFALSNAEWEYLIFYRTNAENLCKCGQKVGGKTNCLLIAPDGFDTSNWHSSNSYTLEEVNSLGLACLPDADDEGSHGYYWSSTPGSVNSNFAGYLGFIPVNAYTNSDYRNYGLSLRLVALPQ